MTAQRPELLVLHGGALGDFILSLPAVEHVKRAHRCRATTMVARGQHGELAVRLSLADAALDLETAGLHGLFARDPGPTLPKRRSQWLAGFATILHFFGPPGSLVSQKLSAITNARVLAVDPPQAWQGSEHVAVTQLAQVGAERSPARLPQVRIPTDRAEPTLDLRRPAVLIHPGSGSDRKSWPLERFITLAEMLQADDLAVIFLLGPVEREVWPIRTLERIASSARVAPELSLPELAALLHRADVYVGNDSGPAHLASLVGTPSVVLFGPSDPDMWRPLGDRVVALQAPDGQKDFCAGIEPGMVRRHVVGLARKSPESTS